MYETFFGLKKHPFLSAPDTASYLDIGAAAECRQTIENAVRGHERISLVFGVAGMGKTLLLRVLRENFEWEYTVPAIINGLIETPKALYQQILYNLHLPFSGTEPTELRLQLLDFVRQQVTPGILLLFDETQYLFPAVLEEIRLLVSTGTPSKPLFQAVFAGTIEFEEKLTYPQLGSFNQLVTTRCYLDSFTKEETEKYIDCQTHQSFCDSDELAVAEVMSNVAAFEGCRIDPPHFTGKLLFSREAKKIIHKLTEGLPRLVNQLCDKSLQEAFLKKVPHVDAELVNAVWSQMQHFDPEKSDEKEVVPMEQDQSLISEEEVEEIVLRKKNTLQLRTFDSTVEFGSLDENEPEQIVSEQVAVYKPAYPDFDDECCEKKEYEETDKVTETIEVSELSEAKLGVLPAQETASAELETEKSTDEFNAAALQPAEEESPGRASSKNDMDAETLEKYGETVLKDRPPFARKEPNYAYQTTETAPETVQGVQYPDSTGNIVVLNWQQAEQQDGHSGTSYTEYAEREVPEPDKSRTAKKIAATLPVSVISTPVTVHTSLNTASFVTKTKQQHSVIDEFFAETEILKPQPVPLYSLYKPERSVQQIASATPFDAAVEKQLESAVQKINAAAAKIEAAAETGASASKQFIQSAELVETEIRAVLPNCAEMFQELSEFQKTVSAELNALRGQSDVPNLRMYPQRPMIAIERKVPAIDVDSLFK
ncbi:hypothetical protein FACS189419_07350 [Planctomycetales bacterium]|nr:hypothetical protein FACS189419_07350 [Planctomycetales bacterium]